MGMLEGTAAIGQFVFNEFMSNIINEGIDTKKEKIKSSIHDKCNKNYSTKIYRGIEDVLNKLTGNKYKDSDLLYEAIEKIFTEFKNGKNEIETVKAGLTLFNFDISDSRCEYFLDELNKVICQDEELFRRISINLEKKGIRVSQEGFQQIGEEIREIKQSINEIKCAENKANILNNDERLSVRSRTQEYLNKWNENMFLNNFTEWDEARGVNIRLSQVYRKEHLPHFIYGNNERISTNIDSLLSQYIQQSKANKMLLILGQPGIGKSTLISWIVANFKDRTNDILVYQFASDLRCVDWNQYDVAGEILKALNLDYLDLQKKTLILDGLDEININNSGKEILDRIYWKLIKSSEITNFSLIITCRENYIRDFVRVSCQYITLQSWNNEQIKSFCKVFCNESKSTITENTFAKIIENKNILGIPLILYMTLALKISIEKEGSIVDVYDKIFSLENGIYDRCIGYAEPHRIREIKEQIHEASKRIAFWMFEEGFDGASIPQEEYQKICNEIASEKKKGNLRQDFIIGNFYKLRYCERMNTNELCFVHRSIYEYFVVENIFTSICEAVKLSKEKLAGILGDLLKKGMLSNTICDLLQYKIRTSELEDKFDIINQTFNLMIHDGMTYYTNKCYKNIMDCEMRVFINMLEVIHLWDYKNLNMDSSISRYLGYNGYMGLNLRNIVIEPKIYINNDKKIKNTYSISLEMVYLQEAYMTQICLKYAGLSYADLMLADLEYADLEGADLRRANLSLANLKGANLKGAILENADLSGSYLEGAVLKNAMLIGADLKDIDLGEADLAEAIFDRKQIEFLEDKYILDDVSVCLETGEIINYQKYKGMLSHE